MHILTEITRLNQNVNALIDLAQSLNKLRLSLMTDEQKDAERQAILDRYYGPKANAAEDQRNGMYDVDHVVVKGGEQEASA